MLTILTDGNSIGHAFHNATKLNTSDGFQTQAIYGFVKSQREFLIAYPNAKNLVLWDGRAQWRYDLWPDYKGNREGKPGDVPDPVKTAHRAAYKKQVPVIQLALSRLGVPQMLNAGAEADDLAGLLTPRIVKAGGRVLLVTGDHDWLQLIGEGVDWYDPRNGGKKVTHATFAESTGYFTPEDFLQGKCLQGDSSDTIPGVGGIGKDTAPKFIAEFRTVEEFHRRVKAGEFVPRLKVHKDLATTEGRAKYERNLKLMNLRAVPLPDPAQSIPMFSELDEEAFKSLCQRLAFVSLLKSWESFIAPFRALDARRKETQ